MNESDAIRIDFGKRGWPGWLRERVYVQSADVAGSAGPTAVGDGDYLIHHGGGVIDVLTAAQFAAKYAVVRKRKGPASDGS